ncbi:MAG TPA: hypothetical protein VGC56_06045 [Allosphingosinicella sp.]|jgi:hypothetical protein
MAKSIDGKIVRLGSAVNRRGSLEFEVIEIHDTSGRLIVWKKMGMQREIAEQLRIDEVGRFYVSTAFATFYGLRWTGETGHFRSDAAKPLMLLMSIGMIFCGLATAVFLFPVLVALAGIAGVVVCLDARRARSRFRRDERHLQRAAINAAQ